MIDICLRENRDDIYCVEFSVRWISGKMRYEILGAARVASGNRCLHIGARKIEVLLVLLLGGANRAVSTSQIMNGIWGDNAPRRAKAAVHVYVSQLRKVLNELGGFEDRIVTQPSGYLLRVEAGELDADLFRHRVREGQAHAGQGRHEAASRIFEQALRHWRGPLAWADECGPDLAAFASQLEELRAESTELLVDTQLELGCHRELVGRLHTLIAQYPLRETFYRQLMLALYRSERRADALDVYRTARQMLWRELRVEPCRPLQQLHREILVVGERLLDDAGAGARL